MGLFQRCTAVNYVALTLSTVLLSANLCAQTSERPAESRASQSLLVRREFDVVSIRPSRPDDKGFSITPNQDDFFVSGSSLAFLIQLAYGVLPSQVIGIPSGLRSARFTVAAKMDSEASPAGVDKRSREVRQQLLEIRLQTMLKDRFHLEVHRATRQMPAFTLTVAPHGPKLATTKEDQGYSTTWGYLSCTNTNMDQFAVILATQLQTFVNNSTELQGGFAFQLSWNTEDPSEVDAQFPSLRNAIKEQLGLKLSPGVEPVPVIIVDHADSPTEN